MAEAVPGAATPAPLDEVMLAMDVVDTLRHRQNVVERELNEEVREADLLKRLKDIYAAQGIDVPDTILKEGVEALKRSRFVYAPPPSGLATSLARLYVNRARLGRTVLIAALGLAVAWGAYTYGWRLPAERAAEQAKVELAETIPVRLGALRREVEAVAQVAEAGERADSLHAEGTAAAAAGNRDTALAAAAGLEALRDELTREYDIRIVQGEGEQSGIWRIPDINPDASNYYLIVEAVAPDGNHLAVPIRSEETGAVKDVTRWGQRVSEAAFDRVRRDKGDDGIIQSDVIGEKRRGYLEAEFTAAVEPGAITEW